MKEVLREFYVQDIPETKKELYDTLRHYLLDEFQKGKVNILIIDEAQLLSYDLLEFIRLLSNIETDKQKILHTVFFAQHEFLDKLKDPLMRHLAQRITVTYCIAPLTYAEVKAYINYRLFKAGVKGPLEFQGQGDEAHPYGIRGYPAPHQLHMRPLSSCAVRQFELHRGRPRGIEGDHRRERPPVDGKTYGRFKEDGAEARAHDRGHNRPCPYRHNRLLFHVFQRL